MLCAFGFHGYAQLETSADFKRQVYDRAYTLGIVGHSRGYALNGRYLKYKDGFNTEGVEVEMTKLRHPKEVRTPNQFASNSRGYVYGRLNSFYSLRIGYVSESILYDKTDQGTVSIGVVYSTGASFGLLKPIYLQVYEESSSPIGILRTVRYNPDKHNVSNIYGEANFFKGFGEISLKPGVYGKIGFSFDFDLLDRKVTSLETGVIYDLFFTEVPIFYEEGGNDVNQIGFFQLYLAVNFGYKKN
ncbi:MAG TPA: hypothetical protein DCG19_15010 [Cryomorphaceae bacterium]|nr:hypothetical protein [Owenweeksia sp.]HAD98720.1 hypothetical protein [Cryomorphaceae bacterium]HBF20784.1 hypothetical protein [Cryomorphaceae bacterium]HCQ17149.1 hypothetical protein [Cryomorphaceae bacterium]|tara:strand:+ start:8429 stop:9160 length:732 start_codon:yes stop_codon:yes gene_type:complete